MPGFIRKVRLAAVLLLMGAMTLALAVPSHAGTGTVRLKVIKAGFIVGGGGGNGSLTYLGKKYYFDVGGIGIGTIGVAATNYSGVACNLRSPGDLAGNYEAVGAGVAVVGGVKAVRLQNARGVVLELRGIQAGFEASLGLGGLTINMR